LSRWDESDDFDGFDEEGNEGFDGEPEGFEPEEKTAEQAYLDELANNLGLDSIDQILINFDGMGDVSNLRGDRFTSLTDALDFLMSIGVIGFSEVVYFEDEDLFGVNVPDDSGGE
jgi:hypothetical protein